MLLARPGSLQVGQFGQDRPATARLPKIDWTHPLAKDLLFYAYDAAIIGCVVDLVGGGQSTTFTARGITVVGPALLFAATPVTFASPPSVRAATAAGNYSWACQFIKTGTAASFAQPFGRNANSGLSQPFNNWDFEINPSGGGQTLIRTTINNFFGGTEIQTVSANGTISDNSVQTAVGILTGSGPAGATMTSYLNGASFGGTQFNITPHDNDVGDLINVGSIPGFVLWGGFWGRPLTPTETMQLHQDPYCFLLADEESLGFPTFAPIPFAYTPPIGSGVNFDFNRPSYSAPLGNRTNFNFGAGAPGSPMSGMTNYWARKLIDHSTGKTAIGSAPTIYIGLFTTAPTDAGGGTEVTGGSYARKSTAGADWNAASGSGPALTNNANAITFVAATADWGTVLAPVVAFGGFDASSGGNLLWWDYIGGDAWVPFSCSAASPGVLTVPSHGFTSLDKCVVSGELGGTLPATAGSWAGILSINVLSADTFSVGVNTTGTGNGFLRRVVPTPIFNGQTASFAPGALTVTQA